MGEELLKLEKKKNISQAQLADMIHVSTVHISNIENGKKIVGLDCFMQITEAPQVSADWLLQTDIPQTSALLDKDIHDLFSDCSNDKKKKLIKIVKTIKETF